MVAELKDLGPMELHYVEAMDVDKIIEGQTIIRQRKLSARSMLPCAIRKKRRWKAAPWGYPHFIVWEEQ